ncbi:MAG: hypothetical protein GWM98_19085 [Nitrospinaceae bacterium]|nr:hypothetical protein [Nitrospinaceae bacterium]NIR56198.1 hypothetical protein [Nitrospinaceae bacterium]NIS86654.1 hypothetical protein [Nitrospinaceae bacterium]NIT83487.1 hypothetical protein [Nitrospinaceae bacterium]NIU45692.1 hypothetical protein [Nitrospinaceae bacterium]
MGEHHPVVDSIKYSIEKSGFPEKTVRLPFKPVYESCKKNGTPLAEVLDHLKGEGILGSMEGDSIVFRSPQTASQEAARTRETQEDPSWWSKLSGLGDMQAMAKEAMAKMTPEQLAEVKKKVDSMSDEEKKNIINMMSQFIKKGQ